MQALACKGVAEAEAAAVGGGGGRREDWGGRDGLEGRVWGELASLPWGRRMRLIGF